MYNTSTDNDSAFCNRVLLGDQVVCLPLTSRSLDAPQLPEHQHRGDHQWTHATTYVSTKFHVYLYKIYNDIYTYIHIPIYIYIHWLL